MTTWFFSQALHRGNKDLLVALSYPVPEAWERKEEQQKNDAEGEVDLLLDEAVAEDEATPGLEATFEMTLQQEVIELSIMEVAPEDTQKELSHNYALKQLSTTLKSQLEVFQRCHSCDLESSLFNHHHTCFQQAPHEHTEFVAGRESSAGQYM